MVCDNLSGATDSYAMRMYALIRSEVRFACRFGLISNVNSKRFCSDVCFTSTRLKLPQHF